MDGNHQTHLNLRGGARVTMNIGLGVGSTLSRITVPHRLRTVGKLLPQIMQPEYEAILNLVPKRTWTQEPLLVVHGLFKEDVNQHLILWQGILDMGQDCIAIYYHATTKEPTSKGILFGPAQESWGHFNVNLFSFIGDVYAQS